MNFKSLFILFGFIGAQIITGNAFAGNFRTEIVLSEEAHSGKIQEIIDRLTLKLKNMTDENGQPIDPDKISSETCFGFNDESSSVFVFYNSAALKKDPILPTLFQSKYCKGPRAGGYESGPSPDVTPDNIGG